jgi:hypothetical protein
MRRVEREKDEERTQLVKIIIITRRRSKVSLLIYWQGFSPSLSRFNWLVVSVQ